MRAIATIGLSLALLAAALGWSPPPAAASSADEQLFVALINQTRAEAGLAPLIVDAELAAQARAWTTVMADADSLSHSPDLSAGISAPWIVLGENVGRHGHHEPEELFQAFVDSPTHYSNLVDPRYGYVGVGVVNTGDGKLWTTHRFMAIDAPATVPSTTAPPRIEPTPTTAPPTTVPPSTPPPTTAPPTSPPATSSPPTTARPSSAGPTTTGTIDLSNGGGPDAATAPIADLPLPEGDTSPVADDPGDRSEPVGPIQADVPTIEEVLIDLVEAGI